VHEVPPALISLDTTDSYAYIQPYADTLKDILPELTVGGVLAEQQDAQFGPEVKTPVDSMAGDIVQDEHKQRPGLLWCLQCPTPMMRIRAMSADELKRHLQERYASTLLSARACVLMDLFPLYRHDIRNPTRHLHYSVL